jgi:hypothetical protein
MRAERDALQQRLAEAEKNAARYLFLRDGDRGGLECWDEQVCVCDSEDTVFGAALDMMVDGSMAAMADRLASPGCPDGEKAP